MARKEVKVVKKQKPCCSDILCPRCKGAGFIVVKTTKKKTR